jgi:PRTRC genetic system protein E
MSENHENPSASRPGLFAELAQLAAERTLLITVSTVDGGLLCVNFVPKRLTASEDDALATPLCLTGTPAELDRDMFGQIRSYVAAHRALSSNLAEAQHAMAEASKRAREETSKRRAKPADRKPEGQNNIEGQKVRDEAQSNASTGQPSLALFDQPEEQGVGM